MTGIELMLEGGMLLLGFIGLFEGLSWLPTSPLPAVLVILSAMLFLLFPAIGLANIRIRVHRTRDNDKVASDPPRD